MLRIITLILAMCAFSLPAVARTQLTADTTFYADGQNGNDANDCLTRTTACKTPQAALDRAADSYDIGPYTVTIQLASGQTFTSATQFFPTIALRQMVGRGNVVIDGGGSLVTSSAWDAIDTQGSITNLYTIQNIGLSSTAPTNYGQGFCILVQNSGVVRIGNGVNFHSATGGHIGAQDPGAIAQIWGNYTISGGAPTHYNAAVGGAVVQGNGATVTLTGTPNFTQGFVLSYGHGTVYVSRNFVSFSGGATGLRYNDQLSSVIFTNGGGASYFPGNTNGYVDSTSIYN